jgi:hypothetical protein
MGLDIYLYKYEDFDATREREKKVEAFVDEMWEGKKYDTMSTAEKEEITRKEEAFKRSLFPVKEKIRAEDRLTKTNRKIQVGTPEKEVKPLDEEADFYCRTEIRMLSERHPSHLFSVGYFRSSYNEGGFNSVLGKVIDVTLYSLFEPEESEYYVKPDWDKVKERTRAAIDKLNQCIADGNDYNCFKVCPTNIFGADATDKVLSEKEAIDLLVKEKKESRAFNAFSNRHGEFYIGKPLKVEAIIKGRDTLFSKEGVPCVYVVCKDDEGLHWYAQALEVVDETCDYVLKQPDKDKYYLHWSG